jgi:hypothetical protein
VPPHSQSLTLLVVAGLFNGSPADAALGVAFLLALPLAFVAASAWLIWRWLLPQKPGARRAVFVLDTVLGGDREGVSRSSAAVAPPSPAALECASQMFCAAPPHAVHAAATRAA